MTAPAGWILLDKPSGMSSRAAAGRIGRILAQKTFGHIGTLDPMASGLLPLAYGPATKMIPFMPTGCVKEYLFTVQFGYETDTLDIMGDVIRRTDMVPDVDAVRAVLPQFIGDINQVPPQYSAVHVNGRRAYDAARRGEHVDIPPRRVRIDALELRAVDGDGWHFRTVCATGTYVRSIARDVAAAVGTVATVSMIRRIQTNGFSIKDAVTLDFLENWVHNGGDVRDYLRPVDFGLGDIPVVNLDDKDAVRYRNGGFIQMTQQDGLVRVYAGDVFIGMGTVSDNVLRPKRTL